MKKIGIVTWFGGSNYGTSLQAYALIAKLQDLGVKPYLLKRHITWRNILGIVFRFFFKKKKDYTSYGYYPEKNKKIEKFKVEYINQYKTCFGFLGKVIYNIQLSNLHGVIAGSDQIWNPYHTSKFLLLNGMKQKKFSYASSIGVREIPNEYVDLYKESLSDFKLISVREETAVEPIRRLTGKQIVKVLDPTFLLNKSEWMLLASKSLFKKNDFSQPYILCYFIVDKDDYWQKLDNLRLAYNINRVVVVPMHPNHYRNDFEIIDNAGIEDFLFLISNATVICTDSFHATALSINLGRNFVTLLRFEEGDVASQNSRLFDLLHRYNLVSNIYLDTVPKKSNINYAYVNQYLEKDRCYSVSYLKDIINMC